VISPLNSNRVFLPDGAQTAARAATHPLECGGLSSERQPGPDTCASLDHDSGHVHSLQNRWAIFLASESRREKPAEMADEMGRIDEAGRPSQTRNRGQPSANKCKCRRQITGLHSDYP